MFMICFVLTKYSAKGDIDSDIRYRVLLDDSMKVVSTNSSKTKGLKKGAEGRRGEGEKGREGEGERGRVTTRSKNEK